MGQTMAEYVKEEGIRIGQSRAEQARQEGIEIGEERGIEIGKARAARQALTTLLTARFGELPPSVAEAIEQAKIERLESWFAVAVTATSMEEIGLETQH